MEDFVGRDRELGALERSYRSRGGALLPVYGRRRVGKTELIRKFIDDKPGAIYFFAQQLPTGFQLQDFMKVAADALSAPLLARVTPASWKDAFLAVEEAWTGKTKLIIALDEFQWMVESSPELTSVLQMLWDQRWRDSGKVMLILCGSYIGFMEREILGKKAPLFGRRTAQILLKPFNYREAALFHRSYSVVDRARAYFICGGVPLYLRCFSAQRSIEANIAHCILDEYAPLFREPDFLLREELRDVELYYAILIALSERQMPLMELGRRVGLGHNVQYHLTQLINLGYVAKRFPLSTERPTKHSVRYAVDDPLLRFWFRFVSPNESFLKIPGKELTMADRIKPQLDAYFGSCFERLCREALPFLYEREGVRAAHQVGDYWDKETQIDVVGVRKDGVIDLGECKWGAVRSASSIERELDERVLAFPNPDNATIQRRVFSKTKPKKRPKDLIWSSLADLYAA